MLSSKKPQRYGFSYSILSYLTLTLMGINVQYYAVLIPKIKNLKESFAYTKELIILNLILIPIYIIGFIIYAKLGKNYSSKYGIEDQGKKVMIIGIIAIITMKVFGNSWSVEFIIFMLFSFAAMIISIPIIFMLIVTRVFFKDTVDLFKFYELSSNMDPNEEYPFRKNK